MALVAERTREAPPASVTAAVSRGMAEARGILCPDTRSEHLRAWILRLLAVDPTLSAEALSSLPGDADLRARVLAAAATRALEADERDADLAWSAALRGLAGAADPELWLELFNDLCEAAIAAAERDRSRGLALLRDLEVGLAGLVDSSESGPAAGALACALLGEAMASIGDAAGTALLERAEALSRDLPVRDHVLTFVIQTFAAGNQERAASLVNEITDPWARFEARLLLLRHDVEAGSRPADRELAEMLAAAADVDEMRRPQAFTNLGAAIGAIDPAAARAACERGLAAIPADLPQLRALQVAGVAASVAAWDPDWARQLYQEALAAASDEPEAARRAVARIAIAFQIGQRNRDAAQPVLDAALAEARSLDATWEMAHVLDVLFDPRGRPELDLSGASPVLEAVLARVAEDDLRVPGVFGLPEIGRCYLQFDRSRAAQVFDRWLSTSLRSGDVESMLEAALGIYHADRGAGEAALRRVAVRLGERLDAFGMSQFCMAAAEVAPRIAAALTSVIPESRERTRSASSAAIALWDTDPAAAKALLQSLPSAEERSAALFRLVDARLGTGDLPRPAAESEISVCCSAIPQIDPSAASRVRELVSGITPSRERAAEAGVGIS